MKIDAIAAAHLRRADALFEQEQYDACIAEYDTILRAHPDNARAYNGRGAAHHRQQRYEQAIADYRQAVRFRPRHGQAWINLGHALKRLGKPHDAWAAFESAIANEPERQLDACAELADLATSIGRPAPFPRIAEVRAAVDAAHAAEKAGDWKAAVQHYDRALSIDGRFASILVERGLAYRSLDDAATALADFDRALTLRPDYSNALVERGRVHSAAGNLQGALDNATAAAKLDELNLAAWNNRASVLNRMSRFDEALADCDHVLGVDPDYAYGLLNRALALTGLHRHEEALADYRRATALDSSLYRNWRDEIVNAQIEVAKQPRRRPRPAGDPALTEALRLYDDGFAAANRGETAAALARYTEAIAKVDDVPAFHFQRGFVRPTSQEAMADYLVAAELWPGFAMAWSNLASGSLEAKLYDAAQSYAERGLSIDPDSPFLNTFAGRAKANKGDFKGAIAHLDKAILYYPDVPGVFWNRAVVRWELADWRGSADDFREAAKRDPALQADADKWIREAEAKLAAAPAKARPAEQLDVTRREPSQVPDHGGEAQRDDRDWFVPPPDQIGPLRSAYSTLAKGEKPPTTAKRLGITLITTVVCVSIGAGIDWLASVENQFWFWAWPVGLGLIGLVSAWLGSRFEHWVTYVGTNGIARFGCLHSRDNVTTREIFRFQEAEYLQTSATRHYRNGVYEGTSWTHVWSDRNGGTRMSLTGRHHAEKSLPASSDLYRFATAAEEAWSIFLFARAEEAMRRDGCIDFPIGSKDYVRLGEGWIELRVGGKADRREAREIASISLADGQFTVKTTDAKVGFFSSKGVFSFKYGTMANVTLFMIALDKLCGLRIS